jgi:lysophospholipase
MGPWGGAADALRLVAADGVALRAAAQPAGAPDGRARGLVLLLPGRTEFLEKYAGVAAAFATRGFAVAGLDWRGQGGSARALRNPRKGHVGAFAEYLRDVDALTAATAAIGGPRVLVSHSMGGAVALRLLARGAPACAAAVFSAPMWGLAQGRATAALGRALARAFPALGLAHAYAPGGSDTPHALRGYARNVLTSCAEAFAEIEAITRAHEAQALGGPTWGWVRAAYDEMAACATLPLATPSLILAGARDAVVSPEPMRARARRGEARLVELAGARHEPFFETAATRARVWAEIDAFLAAVGV